MDTLDKALIPKVSFGNAKLPKSTMIFNLPAVVTCPGKTSLCAGACYALKAEKQYKNVVPQARKHNLKLTLDSVSFVASMQSTINKKLKKIAQVRIHESGDFYSQEYLNAWYKIAESVPNVTFYAYTKSFTLDFSNKPSNFVLIASFDTTSPEKDRLLYGMKRQYFDNTFSIVDKNTQGTCLQDCTVCNLCWTGKGKDITVTIH